MAHSHYFKQDPALKSKPGLFTTRIQGIDFVFKTDRGVFSKRKLDFGSELLIHTFIKDMEGKKTDGMELLDLGCGYGVVGIIIKRVFPGISLHMTDIHPGALDIAKANCEENFIRYPSIFCSDALQGVENCYDIILTNPPIRAGKTTVFRFYEESYHHLKPQGILYVVIRNQQGAASTRTKLQELFDHHETIAIKAGYRVFKCVKGSDPDSAFG
jgi:16S rRNA (guanine1207-N2)-methyltransferase